MFNEYENKEYTQLDAWKTKLMLLCKHKEFDLDYEVVEDTYNLEDMYKKGYTPRKAIKAISDEIFGLNDNL